MYLPRGQKRIRYNAVFFFVCVLRLFSIYGMCTKVYVESLLLRDSSGSRRQFSSPGAAAQRIRGDIQVSKRRLRLTVHLLHRSFFCRVLSDVRVFPAEHTTLPSMLPSRPLRPICQRMDWIIDNNGNGSIHGRNPNRRPFFVRTLPAPQAPRFRLLAASVSSFPLASRTPPPA